MKIALLTCWPFKSNYDSLFRQMCVLAGNDIHLYHKYTTHKIKDYIEEVSGITINKSISVHKEFDDVYTGKYSTWEEMCNSLDFEDYDEVWLFGAPLSSGSLTRQYPDAYNKAYRTDRGMNFKTYTSKLLMIYLTAKLGHNCPIREVSFDPMEASIATFSEAKDVTVYHGYDIDHLDIKRIDTYQAQFERRTPNNLDKTIDFAFGYTYMSKERDEIHLKIQKLFSNMNIENKQLYVKNKFTNESNELKYDDYIRTIGQSRFTLVVPAYQPKCFSCYRFIESIYNDCLPLLHKSCFVDEFAKSYGLEDFYLNKILVDEDNINEVVNMLETQRLSLLSYFKSKVFTEPKVLATLSYTPTKQGLEQFL